MEDMMKLSVLFIAVATVPSIGFAASGEQIYEKHCASCHSSGMVEAPQIGNPGQWGKRVELGKKSLMDSVKHGHNIMPPQGEALNDEDLSAAIDYILSKVCVKD
jgi:cytochrome c5